MACHHAPIIFCCNNRLHIERSGQKGAGEIVIGGIGPLSFDDSLNFKYAFACGCLAWAWNSPSAGRTVESALCRRSVVNFLK